MTSVLRRKRQTTVWSTPPAKPPRSPVLRSDVIRRAPPLPGSSFLQPLLPDYTARLLVAVALVGLVVGNRPMAAMADGGTTSNHAVKAVSYSTGESGHKLQWLPYRPSKPRTAAVVRAQHLIPATPAIPVRTAQYDKLPPIKDPFGGRALPPPPTTINDSLLKPPSELTPQQQSERSLDERSLDGAYPPLNGANGGFPSLDNALAGVLDGECPRPEDILKKRIGELTTDTKPKDGVFPPDCALSRQSFQPRAWAPITYTWKASGLCHKPLYFEDVHLERYGHSWGPYVQPVLSGAHFFLTVPILPYKMGLYPPCECIYTLGYYRPGSCAPYLLDPLPLSIRAALVQGGATVGAAYLLP